MRAFLMVAAVVSTSSLAQQTPEPPPPPPPLTSTEVECFPSCRSGFICSLGECISRCNPPCGPGQQCLDSGECALPPLAPQPATVSPPAAPPEYTPWPQSPSPSPSQLQQPYAAPLQERPTTRAGLRVSAGWAVGAGIYGIVTMVATATLIGITLGLYDSGLPSTIAGATATIFFAVSNPIIAAGGGSARRSGQVSGLLGARIVGWILYGLSLATAVVMVGLGLADVAVPIPSIVGLGAGAILSTLFLSLDAFVSASQAKTLKEELGRRDARPKELQHAPFVSVVPSAAGRGVGIVGGWGMAF